MKIELATIKDNEITYFVKNRTAFAFIPIYFFLYFLFCFSILAQVDENSPAYHLEKGNYNQAIQHAQMALRNNKDAFQRGQLLTLISRAFRYQQDYSMALSYAIQATTQFDRVEQEREKATLGKAEVFTEIGMLYQNWLSYDKAIENFEKAKQIYKTNQKEREVIELNRKIAHNQFLNGDYEKSEKSYAKLLEEDRKTGDQDLISFSLGKLAIVSRVNNPENSLNYAIEKYNLEAKKGNNFEQVAFAANSIGYLCRQVGQEQKAISYFEKALEALNKINIKDKIILNNLGVTYTALKKYDAAKQYYEEALKINRSKKDIVAIVEFYNYLGANEYLAAHAQEARVQVEKAISIAEKENQQQTLADSYLLLSKI